MGKEDVFISQGKRPIWHQILAAASFTIVIIGVYLFIKEIEERNNIRLRKRLDLLDMVIGRIFNYWNTCQCF